jgi:tRNA(Ile)-lysidine synthase
LTRDASARPVVAVAYSGGRDSTALLHVTARVARDLGIDVVALHVHHGLLAQADDWLTKARRRCAAWCRAGLPVRLLWRRLPDSPKPGDSIEAWAREGRYRALAEMAIEAGADIVLLAHHSQDQAETVLLQLLRGAGPRGLAAMPASAWRGGLRWCRPWLAIDPGRIEDHVRIHRLSHVADPSNEDPRFARSRLRRDVWPALTLAFPDASARLAGAAHRMQATAAALAEQASADLAATGDAAGKLRRADWLALSVPRRAEVLRHWLAYRLGRTAPSSLIERLVVEVAATANGRWPVDGVQECRLYRGRLSVVDRPVVVTPPSGSQAVDLSTPGWHPMPDWGGGFDVAAVPARGLSAEDLRSAELRSRRGEERFQTATASPPRSLKKQFQSAGVAAEDRAGPLVFCRDRLAYVPGLGIDARLWSAPGQAQFGLRWWSGKGRQGPDQVPDVSIVRSGGG